MRRWHSETALMLRRIAIDRAEHRASGDLSCPCFGDRIGLFRKRHPRDCGNPRCGLCHWSKFWTPSDRANARRRAIEFELTA